MIKLVGLIIFLFIFKTNCVSQGIEDSLRFTNLNFISSDLNIDSMLIIPTFLNLKLELSSMQLQRYLKEKKSISSIAKTTSNKVTNIIINNIRDYFSKNNLPYCKLDSTVLDSSTLCLLKKELDIKDSILYFVHNMNDTLYNLNTYDADFKGKYYNYSSNLNIVSGFKFSDDLIQKLGNSKYRYLLLSYADIRLRTKSRNCEVCMQEIAGNAFNSSIYSEPEYNNIVIYIIITDLMSNEITYYYNSNNIDENLGYNYVNYPFFKRRADRNRTWKKIMNIAFTDFMQVYNKKTNQQPTH